MKYLKRNTEIEYNGVCKTLADWAAYLNISIEAFKTRLRQWGLTDKAFQVKGITYGDQTKTLAAWGRELGLPAGVIQHRIAKGMPLEKALAADHYKTRTSLVGMRFSRLVVVEEKGRQCGKIIWLCLCDCGNTKLVQTGNLIQNLTRSCGCLRKYRAVSRKFSITNPSDLL